MKKISPNQPCPCGSQSKYKKCCAMFHKGALAKDALTLMKSRYTAYALGKSDYIIKTTHPDNPDYAQDTDKWKESIDLFSKTTEFLDLKILDYKEGEDEAYVTFNAKLSSGDLLEESRFLKVGNTWFYESAKFPENTKN